MMKQQCMLKFKSLGELQCQWKDGGKQSPRIHKKEPFFSTNFVHNVLVVPLMVDLDAIFGLWK
jgi:hypothetical protein